MSMSSHKSFAYDIEVNGFYYNVLSATTLEVTYGDKKYSGDVSIPSTVTYSGKTYNVVSVGVKAFESCDKLTSIIMDENIKKIGDRAFYGCSSLKTYSFNTKNVGQYVFAYCTSLESVIVNISPIPVGMFMGCTGISSFSGSFSAVNKYAFKGCTSLKGDLNFKNVCFAEEAFADCTGITSLSITPSDWAIGGTRVAFRNAFSGCSGLTTIKIRPFPNNSESTISDLGYGFANCVNLKEIITENMQYYQSKNGVLYNNATLCFLPPGHSEVFVVPEDTKVIGEYAFSTFSKLRRIVLNSSITLSNNSFANCPKLRELYSYSKRPSDITIKGTAFNSQLKGKLRVYVPKGCKNEYQEVYPWKDFVIEEFDVISFDPYETSNEVDGINYKITSDTEVEVIHKDDYSGDIVIPEKVSINNKEYKVTSIGKRAFNINSNSNGGCPITSIQIPNSVTSIGSRAFRGCELLKEVKMPDNIACLDSTTFSACSSLESLVLPSELQEIKFSAFNDGCGLKYIEIPSKVSYVGGFAFQSARSLKTIVTSKGLKEIYYYAFSACGSLKTVVLGNNVEKIGFKAFLGCSQLSRIYSLNPTPPALNQRFDNGGSVWNYNLEYSFNNTFEGVLQEYVSLYVPIGSKEAYQNNKDWGRFTHIIEFDPSTFDPKSLLEYDIPIPFVGTWLGSYTTDGNKYKEQWTFRQDGTGSVTNWRDGEDDKSIISFTYTFTDYSISIKIRISEDAYEISHYPYSLSGDIFTLTKRNNTIHYYKQSDETGIYSIASFDDIKAIHSIRGEKLQTPSKGINIIRKKDGTVKKVLIK